MKILFYSLFALMVMLPEAHADYASARAAYDRGNYETSFKEFSRIAGQNHAVTQFMLGYQYWKGQGVKANFVQAHKWFDLSDINGYSRAAEFRNQVAAQMKPAKIAKAQRLARQWQVDNPKINTADQKPTATHTAPASETQPGNTVARIQQILNAQGYDAGPADGKMGRKTAGAIRRYQGDIGLYQDGEATPSLLTFLEAQYPQDNASQTQSKAATTTPYSASTSSTTPQVTSTQGDNRLAQLLTELQQLTNDAQRSSSADNRFINQLRALINRYNQQHDQHSIQQQLILNEAFSQNHYVRNNEWQITSGEFFLVRGEGLQSRVSTATTNQTTDKKRNKDRALEILGAILGAQQSSGESNSNSSQARPATIHIRKSISNSFDLRLTLNSQSDNQGVFFTVYQGFDQQAGYRLVYTPGGSGSLQLLKLTRQGDYLITRNTRSINLGDGRDHNLTWSRDRNGSMQVSIDGREFLRGHDSGYQDNFDGLSYSNRGGDYTLRDLQVYAIQ